MKKVMSLFEYAIFAYNILKEPSVVRWAKHNILDEDENILTEEILNEQINNEFIDYCPRFKIHKNAIFDNCEEYCSFNGVIREDFTFDEDCYDDCYYCWFAKKITIDVSFNRSKIIRRNI